MIREDPGALNRRMGHASILNRVGEARMALGDLSAARDSFERFLSASIKLRTDHPEISRSHRLVAVAYYKQHELAVVEAKGAADDNERLASLRSAERALARSVECFKKMAASGILQESDHEVPASLTAELKELSLRVEQAAGTR